MNKRIVKKIPMLLFKVVILLLLEFITFVTLLFLLTPLLIPLSDFYQILIMTFLGVLFLLFWGFVLMKVKKKGSILLFVLSIIVLIFYLFLIRPFKINGEAGEYKNGEYVLAISRILYPSKLVSKGKVIIYKGINKELRAGYIVANENEPFEGKAHDAYFREAIGKVPQGNYLVEYGITSKIKQIVRDEDLIYVVLTRLYPR